MHPTSFVPFSVNFTCDTAIEKAVLTKNIPAGSFTPGRWYDVFAVNAVRRDSADASDEQAPSFSLVGFVKDNMHILREVETNNALVQIRFRFPFRPSAAPPRGNYRGKDNVSRPPHRYSRPEGANVEVDAEEGYHDND